MKRVSHLATHVTIRLSYSEFYAIQSCLKDKIYDCECILNNANKALQNCTSSSDKALFEEYISSSKSRLEQFANLERVIFA